MYQGYISSLFLFKSFHQDMIESLGNTEREIKTGCSNIITTMSCVSNGVEVEGNIKCTRKRVRFNLNEHPLIENAPLSHGNTSNR